MNVQRWVTASALAVIVTALQAPLDRLAPQLGLVGMASAQSGDSAKKERETRKTPALRNKVYEKLAEAQAAAEEKQFAEAGRILDEMLAEGGRGELNSYELANVYNLYAFLRYSDEDYDGALKYYEKVVEQPDIPLAMEINTRFTVAQLYFVQEKWNEGIAALKRWFEMTDKPNATAYVLLAQGYYQTKEYDLALENVETAISMHEAEGKLPKEQWYNLARFLYFDKGDTDNALATIKTLLTYYPDKQYWVQASHLYGEKQDSARQLAMMETAHVQGMLDKSSDLVTMAYLYLNAEVPYYAAKTIDDGFADDIVEEKSKNFELGGTAYRQAQERAKAIPMMEKAAQLAEDGELYARLGNIYLDGDQFEQAAEAIASGLKRGGVKRPDQARLVMGMAEFNLGNYAEARRAFRAAAKDERSEKYAKQWIQYIASEEDRIKQLNADI